MNIRKAKPDELDSIMNIYAAARQYMIDHANPDQWSDGYPKRSLIEYDISVGRLYVETDGNDVPHAVFAFIPGIDPTYVVIEHGEWLNDRPYGAIHRIASDGTHNGCLARCVEYCKKQISDLRIDTYKDNMTMQHLLAKHGFVKCGIIHIPDVGERIAYHLAQQE